MVTHWLSSAGGGVSAAVEGFSAAISQAGVDVNVFGLDDAKWQFDRHAWSGAPARTFPVVGPRSLGLSPELRSALSKSECDVVHSHGLWLHPSADVLAWSAGRKPFVVSPHGMLDAWAVSQSVWKKRFARILYEDRVLRQAECIHALNYAEADAIRAFGLKNPIAVIPNGVKLPDKMPCPPAPWAGKIPAHKKALLFLGRLHPKKNVHGLVAAMASLKARGASEDWCLVVAGWDQAGYGKKLADEVIAQGLQNQVIFVGALFGDRKDAAFRNAAAFVLPSFSEGLPLAVLEAWAYGVPVAMSAACNLPEGFQQEAAIEVHCDTSQLTQGLHDLFTTKGDVLKKMSMRGRALVESKFSWEANAKQLLDVYRWVNGVGMRPATIVD